MTEAVADSNRPSPWSEQTTGWHVARWGRLGWAETVVKGLALAIAVGVAVARLVDGGRGDGWQIPSDHRLPFWLLVAIAVGYLFTVIDRWADREVVAMAFVVAMVAGHWSLVWVMGLTPWPSATVRVFATLMAVGELIKIAYFATSGARVRDLPRAVPFVMTGALAVVYLIAAFTA